MPAEPVKPPVRVAGSWPRLGAGLVPDGDQLAQLRGVSTDHGVPLDDLAGLLLALTTAPAIEPGSGFSALQPR